MNTGIDFMKIAEGDKEFVRNFENFVNGKVSSTEKTGMAMTTMHRYLQQQAFKVMLGYMKGLAHNYRKGRYDDKEHGINGNIQTNSECLVNLFALRGGLYRLISTSTKSKALMTQSLLFSLLHISLS